MADADGAGDGKGYLVVRAVIDEEADKAAFDHWYETDHLPLAKTTLQAEKAWRFWSHSDASVHYAVYRLADAATAKARVESDLFRPLIEDFDRAWPKVRRTREILEGAQLLG